MKVTDRLSASELPLLQKPRAFAPAVPGMRLGPTGSPPRHQPAGLFLLFALGMWDWFSQYGMRALLVTHLTTRAIDMKGGAVDFNPGRGWNETDAAALFGWYIGALFLLPMLGGLIADKLTGPHRSTLIGGFMIALGHVMMACSCMGELASTQFGTAIFVTGLAMAALGTGHFKPCVPVMVGELYRTGDPRRDGGFTWFYVGVKLGAMLGTIVCATLGQTRGWQWGFGVPAAGMIAALFIYLIGRPFMLKDVGLAPPGSRIYAPLVLVISLALAAGIGFFWLQNGPVAIAKIYADLTADPVSALAVPIFAAATALGIFLWLIAVQDPGDKSAATGIVILLLFSTLFWIGFAHGGASIVNMAEYQADRTIGSWVMPVSWLPLVNPMVIIVLAPAFAGMWTRRGRRGRNPSQAVKIGLALLILGGGFIFLVVAGELARGGVKVAVLWLLAACVVHALAELLLAPTGLSFVSSTAPARSVSFFMGIWFLSALLASLSIGLVADFAERIEKGQIDPFWHYWHRFGPQADAFMLFVVASIGAGFLVLFISPLLNRTLHGRG